MSFDIASRFLERSRHYLCDEYPLKITAAIRSMPAERLWWRPNDEANSAGNLVLHLAGNVRQWVVSGIGGAADIRHRDAEFSVRDGTDGESLLAEFGRTVDEVRGVINQLTPTSLGETRVIQGRATSVFGALYHVVEHFSGHTGQIILLAKLFTPGAVRFYDDTGGLARPLFMPPGRSDVE